MMQDAGTQLRPSEGSIEPPFGGFPSTEQLPEQEWRLGRMGNAWRLMRVDEVSASSVDAQIEEQTASSAAHAFDELISTPRAHPNERDEVAQTLDRVASVEPLPPSSEFSKQHQPAISPEETWQTEDRQTTSRIIQTLDRLGPVGQPRNGVASSDTMFVRGSALKTWSYASTAVDRMQVVLTNDHRPLDADVELWQGPDYTPLRMHVHSEDGGAYPFNIVVTAYATNAIAMRNTGHWPFPLGARVIAKDIVETNMKTSKFHVDALSSNDHATSLDVKGGNLHSCTLDDSIDKVEITLETDGQPLNAIIELIQGHNESSSRSSGDVKQVIELYTEDGLYRPVEATIETVGNGNTVRLLNTGPADRYMIANIQPQMITDVANRTDPVISVSDPVYLVEVLSEGLEPDHVSLSKRK
jgi:hypothetical protein